VCKGRIPSSPRRYRQALSNTIKAVVGQNVCPWIRLNITNCSAHEETTGRETPTARRIDLAFKISDVCCLLNLHSLVAESTIWTARIKPHLAVVAVQDEATQSHETALTERRLSLRRDCASRSLRSLSYNDSPSAKIHGLTVWSGRGFEMLRRRGINLVQRYSRNRLFD
jgi:hypothetical protein